MKLNIVRTEEDEAGGPSLNLEQAIAEFYADFPEHKKDVFILNHQKFDSGRAAVEAIAPALDAVKAEHPEAKLPLAKSMAAGMFAGKLPCSVNISESAFNMKAESAIFARIVIPAGDEFSARLMKSIFVSNDPVPNGNFPVMKEEFNDTEMWHRYVLDHELGHAVTQLALKKEESKVSSLGNRAECEADAYAMIRHYQRYGAGSAFPEYVRDLRNMNAVHKGDVTHWTVRALDEVIELNGKGLLAGLDPHQARDLAVEIAARAHLSTDAEHNMTEAFAPLAKLTHAAREKRTPDGSRVMTYIDTVCALAAETKSPAVHETCVKYMAAIGGYVPKGLKQDRTPQQIETMAQNLKKGLAREVKAEPQMAEYKRAFRDAFIDAQSGKTKPAGNDNDRAPPRIRKPGGPKPG